MLTTLILFHQKLTQDYLQIQVDKLANQKNKTIKQIKIVVKQPSGPPSVSLCGGKYDENLLNINRPDDDNRISDQEIWNKFQG